MGDEAAPFPGILITAGTPQVPRTLFDQLAPKGRLVAPIGPLEGVQELLRYRSLGLDEPLEVERLLPVRFVPLTATWTLRPQAAWDHNRPP